MKTLLRGGFVVSGRGCRRADVLIGGEKVMRKADLRAFVLTGAMTAVWPSGLTRYAREAGNAIVNSSQGGGFKDTWVLND